MSLILIRGLPGSGKSTYVKKKVPSYFKHVEADQWHVNKDGKYIFDPKELESAHKYCLITTEYHLRKSHSVVVSNTFTQYWEMAPYFELAKKYNVRCQVFEMKTRFKNVHGVSPETLEKMENRWESYESVKKGKK